MIITTATTAHAADIAQLIMTAMTDDCCQFLAGKDHTLDDFYQMMVKLVLMDDSQYSCATPLLLSTMRLPMAISTMLRLPVSLWAMTARTCDVCAAVFRRKLSVVLVWTTAIWTTRHRRASSISTRLPSTPNTASVALPLSCYSDL